MSESELEEILREVKQRANANATFNNININPPKDTGKEPEPQGDKSEDTAESRKNDETVPVPDNKSDNKNEEELHLEIKKDDVKRQDADGEEYFDMLSVVDSDNADKHAEPKAEQKNKGKRGLIIALAVILIIALASVVAYLALNKDADPEPTPKNSQSTVVPPEIKDSNCNPLTGESNYSEGAIGQRPVAVVVENEYGTSAVRPQWGIDEADIVLEGESEFSTRLLLFWADYNDVPDMVGPTRSARPPFIRFSQLFDSIFIHAGLSHSQNDYIGADTVFETDDVDHVNLLSYPEDGTYFGRNYDRENPAVEHTGFLNGANVPQLLQEEGFNTDIDYSKFTVLSFNDEAKSFGTLPASSCSFKWSANCPKEAVFSYDESTHKYVTEDFDSRFGESGVQFENLIFLLADTEYIVNADYKGGQGETYCDYDLQGGGTGTVISEGYAIDITWGVTDGKLWMKDSDGNSISLNAGKSYIGYGSNNNGGRLALNTTLEEAELNTDSNNEDYDYNNDFDMS